jgi:hypothetical protein
MRNTPRDPTPNRETNPYSIPPATSTASGRYPVRASYAGTNPTPALTKNSATGRSNEKRRNLFFSITINTRNQLMKRGTMYLEGTNFVPIK